MTVKPLSSATSVLEGTTFPLGRVHLYNADTSEFIMEAIADETGHYKIALPALQSEDKYYRLTHNQQEDLVSVHLDTVDGSSILLDKSVMASLATYLQDADMDEATDEDPIIVPKLHNKKIILSVERYILMPTFAWFRQSKENSILQFKWTN